MHKVFSSVFRFAKQLVFNIYFFVIPGKKFVLNKKKYSYFRHPYNRTWENERIVEIPLIYKLVKCYAQEDILEIGNVLENYYPFLNHDVLDKYESGSYIISGDAEFFRPTNKYKLIISISTMEHIGWDETPRDPEKLLRAFKNIVENCLTKNGVFAVTMPIGYNTSFDAFLDTRRISFTKKFFLRRISKKNTWVESGYSEVKGIQFGYPFQNANAIMFAIIKK